jgi:hypothetical protein
MTMEKANLTIIVITNLNGMNGKTISKIIKYITVPQQFVKARMTNLLNISVNIST